MKGFMLDAQGDVVIESGVIQMVHGAELTAQTVKSVLETQKGEWFLNWEEGINRDNILGKKRHTSKNSSLANQYIKEIDELKRINASYDGKEDALNEMLAKRLDGET